MSGANAATAALQDAAQNAYRATFEAGSKFARAHTAVRSTTDVIDTMSRSIDLLVAAEALHDAADQAVAALRNTLAQQLLETGATTIQGTHHSARVQRKPQFVSIEQEDLIPPEFVVLTPRIDKRMIANAIKNGLAVAGASLATPNEPVLVISALKEKAA